MTEDEAARRVAHFKILQQTDGRFHWVLLNPHGTFMSRAMESFETEEEAFANAGLARRLISEAPITT